MTTPVTEEEFIKELAAEYAKQGFHALVSPSDDALPDFLRGVQVDLLLASATENIVVQVKSRSAARADQDLPRLAAVLEGRPNWRLEFMMLPEPVSQTRSSLPNDLATAKLTEARSLLETGHHAAALLLGWGAAEAVFRLRLGSGDSNRFVTPQALVSDLFSRGELSDESYRLLRSVMESRNATAHGFQASPPDIEVLRAFFTLVESLLPK